MGQDTVDDPRVGDDRDHGHFGSATSAKERIEFQDLAQQPGPVPLADLGEGVVLVLGGDLSGWRRAPGGVR